ncbi:uncharacterized protein LOC119723861 isoform X2 [Patiria miniata]|uniref:PDZ domain-containing protein n=1 Tax=Patiria miniata TaxID=46514 RepID=A0A913ZHY5_PATMI|nr:uncharacterized protein LOC119723861 isoform X2 [Patiria miniata]
MSEDDTPTNLAAKPTASTAFGAPQRPRKRPPSADHDDDSRAYKSQRSVSDEIGPGIRQFCRLQSNPKFGDSHVGENLLAGGGEVDEAITIGPGGEGVGQGNNPRIDPGQTLAEPRWDSEEEEEGELPCSQGFQQVLGGGVDVIDGIFSDLVHAGKKQARKIVRKLVERFRQVLPLPQSSLEHRPDNNVHVRHPDKLIGGMVGLGMHIQKDAKGHLVHSVIPDGLAAKSKLQENDIIVSVNENDVTSWEFEELQQFFGSLEEVDFKIVVEREQEDEGGAFVCHKVTISIKILLEGDQVMVDIDVKVHVSQLQFNGESEPYYIFQNQSDHSTKYLILKNNCFCMSTANDLTPCRFKRFYYSYGAMAFININNNSPLDHGEPSRIGVNSSELTDKISEFWTDDRIFFTGRQDNTAMYTFQLASQKDFYLTTDAKGNLTTTFFSDKEAVDASGQFSMEPKSKIDKMTPSDIQKYNSK